MKAKALNYNALAYVGGQILNTKRHLKGAFYFIVFYFNLPTSSNHYLKSSPFQNSLCFTAKSSIAAMLHKFLIK